MLGLLGGCFPVANQGEFCDQYTLFPSVCADGLVCCDRDPEIADDGGICLPEAEGCPDLDEGSTSN